MTINNTMPLDEVLYAFATEGRELNANLLDEYVRAYPDYADALTHLAISLTLDAITRPETAEAKTTASEMTTVTPAVSLAMSKFQNRLYEMRKSSSATAKTSTDAEKATVRNPFKDLDRKNFRVVTQDLNASTAFVLKLRDRQIDVATMSTGFLNKLAEVLRTSVDAVVAHLKAEPSVLMSPQFNKAEEKPHVAPRQSFQDAVKSSDLSPEQQKHLLNL